MPNRLLCLLLLFVLLFICAFVIDDNNGIKLITLKLEKLRKNYPQEKVYLHTDKPYYSLGDTIYFKAYVVNAEKNLPSVVSNILYVDMIDDSNYIVQTLRLPILDGITWGTIDIADSLSEGGYRIRAYTNWMRNFDKAYFFNKVVTVGNGLNSDLVANASFKLNSADNKTDTLTINYSSLRSLSAENKEVNYSVIVNKKEINKGKAFTDSEGRLNLSLTSLHLQNNQRLELRTRIRLDDKTTVTKLIQIQVPVSKHTIQFFPEGGQMVTGFPTHVGFKAVNADGLGINVSGQVMDDSTSDIIPFKSGFAGIGSFEFMPLDRHTYHALVHYKDGSEQKVVMPKAEACGYVLNIDNTDPDKIAINVNSRQSTPADKVVIVAQSNNRIQYTAALNLSNSNASITISKKKFPTGIVQFTLFNAAMQPAAERLAFINHQDQLTINIVVDKTSYSKRAQVRMALEVKDEKGNPVTGTFSLAVTDANTVFLDKTKEQSILSDLLLTSDIRGYVESPGYYFTDVTDDKVKALDNLLLTQGWRRFAWKDVLSDNYPSTPFAAEKSLAISGKVLSKKGEPVPNNKITLLSKKDAGFILDTVTDVNGNFTFNELSFDDNKPFVVQAADSKGSNNLHVKLTTFSPPPATGNTDLPAIQQTPNSVLFPYLKQSHQQYDEKRKRGLLQDKSFTLKEVTVATRQLTKIQEAVTPSANLNGPGNADQILTYEDLQNCHDLAACLRGKVIGVIFKMVVEDPNARVKVWHLLPFSMSGMNAPMLVVLDGMDINVGRGGLDINNIPVQNIQSIEVLRSGGYLPVYGMRGSGGILVITTKQGDIDYNAKSLQNNKVVTDVVFTTAKGYSVSRQFYVPDYSNPAIYSSTMPDLRSTIFWQPNIVTDEDGKATVEFYNADTEGNCNVVIEGVSTEGNIGHACFTYTIKEHN